MLSLAGASRAQGQARPGCTDGLGHLCPPPVPRPWPCLGCFVILHLPHLTPKPERVSVPGDGVATGPCER